MFENAGGINDADGGGYLSHAVLDDSTRTSIRETNAAFLMLVAHRHAAWPGGGAFGLDAGSVARIAALDPAGRRASADCPYTLFNLRFEDAEFWEAIARDPGARGTAGVTGEAAFARTAVFLAWHLAQHSDLAAALVLGMTASVQMAWRRLPLSALDGAASAVLPQLAARWGDHPRFWPKLLEAVAPVDRARADAVRLLGLQLLAAQGIRSQEVRVGARPPRP